MPKSKWNRPTCPEHNSWSGMWDRCINPNSKPYHYYGGRGITVCERWRDFFVFAEDMGRRPPKTSIERIDVDGNYEPSNCKWATTREQSRNRRDERMIFYDFRGEKMTRTEIARSQGIDRMAFTRRLDEGLTPEEAIVVINNVKESQKPLNLTCDGATKTLTQWSRQYGIPKKIIHQRIVTNKWSVEKAIKTPITTPDDRDYSSMKTMVEIDGVLKGKREWARHYEIEYETVRRRVKKGMSFVEAVQKPSSRKT